VACGQDVRVPGASARLVGFEICGRRLLPRTLRQFRDAVRSFEGWVGVAYPDVDHGLLVEGRVEGADAQDHLILGFPFGHEVRAAARAEPAVLAGRAFEGGDDVCALRPLEAGARRAGGRRVGAGVRLLARAAMAEADRA
jgi:hypothetical protein